MAGNLTETLGKSVKKRSLVAPGLFAVGLACFAQGCTLALPNRTSHFRAAVIPVLRAAGSLRERLAFEGRPGSADEKPWDRYLADGRAALSDFRKSVQDLPEPESKEQRFLVAELAAYTAVAASCASAAAEYGMWVMVEPRFRSRDHFRASEASARNIDRALEVRCDRLAAAEEEVLGSGTLRDCLIGAWNGRTFSNAADGVAIFGPDDTTSVRLLDGLISTERGYVRHDLASFR